MKILLHTSVLLFDNCACLKISLRIGYNLPENCYIFCQPEDLKAQEKAYICIYPYKQIRIYKDVI